MENHEYYKTHLNPVKVILEIINPFKNITLLDDNYEIYKGYCFIGTTLWSNVLDIEMAYKYKIYTNHTDYIPYNKILFHYLYLIFHFSLF